MKNRFGRRERNRKRTGRYIAAVFISMMVFWTSQMVQAASGRQIEIDFTEEEREFIENTKEVTIVFIPNRSPLSGENKDGEICGITVDILNLLEQRSGIKFQYKMMPAGMRVVEYLNEHPDELVAGVLSDSREFVDDKYLLTDDIYSDDVALICKAGMDYEIDAEDAAYQLAIPKSYASLEHYVNEHYPQFEVIMCDSTRECVQMVENGKVDLAAQNVRVLEPILSDPHFEDITVVPAFFMRENTAIVSVVSEEHGILTGILNKCIATVSETEISQFTVDHTVASVYRMTFSDVLYQFRYPLIAIGVLVMTLLALMVAFQVSKKQSYLCLEAKNRELADAVERADRANAAKSEFLARMSHEIRTPMNTIVALTALAKEQQTQPEKLKEDLEKIQVSSKLLLNIINDVLDMSAIELHKMKTAQKLFDMRELVSSIATVYESECRQKDIRFHIETKMTDRYLLGDAIRVQQIIMNLLSNAYKFTPVGGEITIAVKEIPAEEKKAYYKFEVRDNGEGITEEMQQRLFLPFEQEGADTYHKYGGSGLGLAIVKNLVELMKGTIACESKKGEGAVFTVILPFELAPEELWKEEKKEIGEEKPVEIEKKQYDFGGKTVLLAEDTEMNADITRDLLELVHLKTVWAKDGERAVKLFEASAPGEFAAILMDIHMPKMNGYEAARAIRSMNRPDAETVPIFAMTANAFEEDIKESQEAGMNEHIAKPVDIYLLYGLLAKFLQK